MRPPKDPIAAARRSVTQFAALSLGALAADRVFAFIFTIMMSVAFGSGRNLDLYLLAVTGPTLISILLGEVIYSLLLPEFMANRSQAIQVTSQWAVIGWVTVGLAGVTALYAAAWAGFLGISDRGSDSEQLLVLGISMSPVILFSGIGVLCVTALTAIGRYAEASLRIPATSLITVLAFAILRQINSQVDILALSVVAGAAGSAVAMVSLLVSCVGLPTHGLRIMDVHLMAGRVSRTATALLVTGIAAQAPTPIERLVGFEIGTGIVSSLNYGRVLVSPPLLIAQSIATAIFPQFVDLNSRQTPEAARALGRVIGLVSFLLLPMSVALAFIAEPLVQIVYHHGAFDSAAVTRTATSASILAVSLIPIAVSAVTTRFLYATGAANRVAIATTGSVALYSVAALALARFYGFVGLAAASSVSSALLAAVLLATAVKQQPGTWSYLPLTSFVQSGLSGLVMAISMTIARAHMHSSANTLSLLLTLGVLIAVGSGAYGVTAFLIRSPDFLDVVQALQSFSARYRHPA